MTISFELDPIDPRFVAAKAVNSTPDDVFKQIGVSDDYFTTRKRDGFCVLVGKGASGKTRLYTRTCNEVTRHFPHVVERVEALGLPKGTIIGVELMSDRNGQDNADYVNGLFKLASPEEAIERQQEQGQLKAMPFNVFVHDYDDWTERSNEQRVDFLTELALRNDPHGDAIIPMQILDGTGPEILARCTELAWEGAVVYHKNGKTGYRLDGRHSSVVRPPGTYKLKPSETDDFIAVGYTISDKPRHNGAVKDLILQQIDVRTGELIDCGKCGLGLSIQDRWDLLKVQYPFVVEVRYNSRQIPKEIGSAKKGKRWLAALKTGVIVRMRGPYDKTAQECTLDLDALIKLFAKA